MTDAKRDQKQEGQPRQVGPKNRVTLPRIQRIPMPHESLIRPIPSPPETERETTPLEIGDNQNLGTQSPTVGDWVPSSYPKIPVSIPNTDDPVGTQSPAVGTQSPTVGTQSPSDTALNDETTLALGTQSPTVGTQSPTVGTQSPAAESAMSIKTGNPVTQFSSLPEAQSASLSLPYLVERNYKSRVERAKKGWRIPVSMCSILSDLAYRTGVGEQDLVEEALGLLFEKYYGPTGNPVTQFFAELGTQSPSHPVTQSPTYLINELNKNKLIELFLRLTAKAHWDDNDERILQEVEQAGHEVLAIECGIRESKRRGDRARREIRSFGYCVGAIEEASQYEREKLEQRVKRLRYEQFKLER